MLWRAKNLKHRSGNQFTNVAFAIVLNRAKVAISLGAAAALGGTSWLYTACGAQ